MGQPRNEDELQQLWQEWTENHEPDTKAALIEHYLPLIEFLSKRLGRQVPYSYRADLYSFAAIGLMDAIDKFKPELGYRFETYASRRIRGAMSDGLRALDWLPRGASERASRVIETIVPFDFKSARTPGGMRFEDTLADPVQGTLFDNLELLSEHAEVAEAIGELPEREQRIVKDHYYGSRRLADIGKDMGITESRVCQLHRRALRMLQVTLAERLTA
jgi:RNA polymerase sigma factor for flagellar operon FliA